MVVPLYPVLLSISIMLLSDKQTSNQSACGLNLKGVLHDDLKAFLEANVPTGKKKTKVLLGVADPKLGAAIQEMVNICCDSGGLVSEVLRGVRCHFEKMIKGLTGPMAAKAQLGLGHSYSRAKVKFNVHRVDNMIIQSISLLDQLDKDINTFSMRIR